MWLQGQAFGMEVVLTFIYTLVVFSVGNAARLTAGSLRDKAINVAVTAAVLNFIAVRACIATLTSHLTAHHSSPTPEPASTLPALSVLPLWLACGTTTGYDDASQSVTRSPQTAGVLDRTLCRRRACCHPQRDVA